MKAELQQLVSQALERLAAGGEIPSDQIPQPVMERTRDSRHGDFACNSALVLARIARAKPRALAEKIVAALPPSQLVEKVEIAGPGFINFFLSAAAHLTLVPEILEQGYDFGRSDLGAGKRTQVEFVSANPTGPLHVGHGRGAAYGAVVADLLAAVGFKVHREYYVNDAGRQMDILGTSVWLRYLELCGEELPFPSNGYQGDYIWDIAATLHRDHADAYRHTAEEVFADVPADATEQAPDGDKEAHIDALIARAKQLLGDNRYRFVFELALNTILDDIRDDLELFGVTYDEWYSERTLTESGAVNKVMERLRNAGHVYEKQGALWFRSTAFGDEKDRVVERENGQTTYFASDIAYHVDKLERGFERVIDVWGADHHGYVPRVKAALQALGDDPSRLDVLLVQFANLYRGGEKVQMSTRSGSFVTLRSLRKEVGRDAARFFYVMRKCEQHLDFDLDLAKVPVQRQSGVLRSVRPRPGVQRAAPGGGQRHPGGSHRRGHAPGKTHRGPRAGPAQHPGPLSRKWWNRRRSTRSPISSPSICGNWPTTSTPTTTPISSWWRTSVLRDARIKLILAARQVLKNGLNLLGVSAPESM